MRRIKRIPDLLLVWGDACASAHLPGSPKDNKYLERLNLQVYAVASTIAQLLTPEKSTASRMGPGYKTLIQRRKELMTHVSYVANELHRIRARKEVTGKDTKNLQ